jgi:HEAT repeat protein
VAITTLIELLDEKEPHARTAAIGVLEQIGPEAKAAIPALTKLLEEKEVVVRDAAAQALRRIGVGSPSPHP